MRPSHTEDVLATAFDLEDLDIDEKDERGAEIELRNVSFAYPTRDVPVLNHLDLKVSIVLVYR